MQPYGSSANASGQRQQQLRSQNIPPAPLRVEGAAAAAGNSGRRLTTYSDPTKSYGSSLSDNTSEPMTRGFYHPPPGISGRAGSNITAANAAGGGFLVGGGILPAQYWNPLNSRFVVAGNGVGGNGGNNNEDGRGAVHQMLTSGLDMDAYAQYMMASVLPPPMQNAAPAADERMNRGDTTGAQLFFFFFPPWFAAPPQKKR